MPIHYKKQLTSVTDCKENNFNKKRYNESIEWLTGHFLIKMGYVPPCKCNENGNHKKKQTIFSGFLVRFLSLSFVCPPSENMENEAYHKSVFIILKGLYLLRLSLG